jgi:hypothetical protein
MERNRVARCHSKSARSGDRGNVAVGCWKAFSGSAHLYGQIGKVLRCRRIERQDAVRA